MKSTNILKCLTILGLIGSVGNVTVKAEELTEPQEITTENETLTEEKKENTIIETPTEVEEDTEDIPTSIEEQPVSINGTGYDKLEAAIDEVQSGETITINQNIEVIEEIEVDGNKNFTIDFQDHECVFKLAETEVSPIGFSVNGDSTVTLKDGTVSISESEEDSDMDALIASQDGGSLTLNNMTIEAKNRASATVATTNGNITFQGYTYVDSGFVYHNCAVFFGILNSNEEATITFDESYKGTINGSIGFSEVNGTASLVIKGNGTFGEIEMLAYDEIPDPNIQVYGGTFDSLDVLDYVEENAKVTIDLKEDATKDVVIPVNSDVTINLNGHTIMNESESEHTITNNGDLTITGEGTVENTKGYSTIYNEVGAAAELNGGIYKKDIGNEHSVIENYGTMIINRGVTVTQPDMGLFLIKNGGGWIPDGSSAKLVINGGTFGGSIEVIRN